MDFYPSISEKLLNEALAWASDLATITENDISIIKHARKSLLFGNGKLWTKNNGSNSLFDVTMASFDYIYIYIYIYIYRVAQKKVHAFDLVQRKNYKCYIAEINVAVFIKV